MFVLFLSRIVIFYVYTVCCRPGEWRESFGDAVFAGENRREQIDGRFSVLGNDSRGPSSVHAQSLTVY